MKNPKTPIKIDDWNNHMEDKRENQKNAKRRAEPPAETKEGREVGPPLVVGSYLTHSPTPPSNVTSHM